MVFLSVNANPVIFFLSMFMKKNRKKGIEKCIFLTNTQVLSSQDVNGWSGIL